MSALLIPAVLVASLLAAPLAAQTTSMPAGHQHTPGMTHPGTVLPTEAGQDAFAAIAEVVKLLDADPMTDWSKVDLEALRRHLIDMNVVTLKSSVQRTQVVGGVSALYGRLNGVRARAEGQRRSLGSGELTARFAALVALIDPGSQPFKRQTGGLLNYGLDRCPIVLVR